MVKHNNGNDINNLKTIVYFEIFYTKVGQKHFEIIKLNNINKFTILKENI